MEDDERRAKASGEEEGVSEMDALLADMALEIEEMARVASGRRESAVARQERLEEEGAAIRGAALGRAREEMGREEAEGSQEEIEDAEEDEGSQ